MPNSKANRVILNSGFLYANMLVTMAVQLVSVRILVNALGVNDYGIYSLVAGLVALFAFINVAMAASTQRFLSYAIGEGKAESVREIFYQSVVLHIAIGVLVLVLLEAGGLYYVLNFLRAPADRIPATTLLLHCITASTFVNIITVPYEADINANENMGVIAAINILDSFMKLGVALCVMHASCDRLRLYGLLTMACMAVTLLLKRFYCLARYPESRFKWHRVRDFSQARRMVSFTVWNLIGSGCSVARYQGTGLVINQFFALAVNTAYGVAQQVNGLLLFFANTIVRAIRPQVVKSEGNGDRARMLRLSVTTCKVTSLMVALLAVPLGISVNHILRVWLGHAPSGECVMFCRSFLAIVFLNQLTIGLQIGLESAGRIMLLQCTAGVLHLMPVLLGYACFRMGMPPASIMLCIVGEELVALFVRAAIARRLIGLAAGRFLSRTVLPCVAAVAAVTALTWQALHMAGAQGWWRCIASFAVSMPALSAVSYFWIISEGERRPINEFFLLAFSKIRPRRRVSP